MLPHLHLRSGLQEQQLLLLLLVVMACWAWGA
jgi:hypothetical protein